MRHLDASLWAYSIAKLGSITRHLATATDAFGPLPVLPQRRVVVTGIGLVTPLGVGVRWVWERLLAGDTAVRALTPEDLPEEHRSAFAQLPSKVVACVPRDQLAAAQWTPAEDPRRTPPFVLFALTAAAEALQDAGWAPFTDAERDATGVAIGSGMSSTVDVGEAGVLLRDGRLRRLSPFFVPRILPNMPAGAVSMAHRLRGPNHAVATACATGAHGVGDAFRAVQRGDADVMVAGGTESCIDGIALGGFSRLKALSTRFNDRPEAASRPFDRDRDGFVMGEGAGVLVLEELEHARARGARMYAEIRGYGMSGDAHHVTQPPADGAGAQLAMRRALASGGVAPRHLSYINAHATSTPIGDDVEQRAIAAVLGAAAGQVAVSSIKGAVGHLLGAAGAVEAAIAALAVAEGWAPPNVNLETADPQLLGNLVGGSAVRLAEGPRAVLSNSFGFGGTNASLLLASPPGGDV